MMRGKIQKSIDIINVATRSQSPIDTNARTTSFEDSYFHFDPSKILFALVDLSHKPSTIEITNIHVDKKFLADFKDVIIPSDFGPKGYAKVMEEKELTLADLGEVYFNKYSKSVAFSYLTFEIKIHKDKLEEKLNIYLDAFIGNKLTNPVGLRYLDPKKQRQDILAATQKLSEKYGSNMVLTAEEVAKAGGWYLKDEHHYRFHETILALEKSGDIKITDLRKDEVVFTLNEKVSPQTVPVVTPKKAVVEDIKSITFISENKKADKVSSFYINHHIHDVHKMQRLSSEVRKLARVADGEEVPFEKQTYDYINTNKNCVLYCKGKYKLTKIIDGHSKPLKISRGIEVEVIDDKIFKRRVAQTEKVSA